MSTAAASVRTVVITGGLGNLGSKLCRHLLGPQTSGGVKYRVVLLEHPNFIDPQKSLPHDDAIVLPCDLGNIGREDSVKLEEVLTGADAVVHFSAVNPYPNASWGESARSCDHAFNIFQLAVKCKVRRVILASSNHVMGGYKDDDAFGPGSVRPDSAPRVGTVPLNPAQIASSGDGKAYAAAKLAAERLAMTLGSMYGGNDDFRRAADRVVPAGENHPSTLSAAGSPPEFLKEGEEAAVPEQSEDDKKDELWYKRMWLSNRDFLAYFDAALRLDVPTEEAKGDGGPHRNVRKGFMLVNAMSRNSGAKWNLEETEKWLGVKSNDDSLA